MIYGAPAPGRRPRPWPRPTRGRPGRRARRRRRARASRVVDSGKGSIQVIRIREGSPRVKPAVGSSEQFGSGPGVLRRAQAAPTSCPGGGSSTYFASYQFPATAASTTRSTCNGSNPTWSKGRSINFTNSASAASAFSEGPSRITSSWICKSNV